ncbi:PH domain-containing protein [Leucobacter aridicollis]|nr:PH domain-containing protein [Leucobacter aridicollis]
MPGTADSDGWRRLHPISPLLRGGLVLLVLIGVFIANFRDLFVRMFVAASTHEPVEDDEFTAILGMLSNGQTLLLVLGGVVLLLLVIVGASWVAWRFHTYRVSGEAVESRSGVLFRQHRRAPLDRVQSVNLQRPLLARLLGLTKIEVLTGGQGGKVELAYLGHRDAKAVRERILQLASARRSGAAPEADPGVIAPAAAVSYDGTRYAEPSDALTGRVQDFADFDVDPEAAAAQALVRVPLGRLLGSILLGWEAVITVILLLVAVFWGLISSAIGAVTGNSGFLAAGGISLLTVIPLILVTLGMMFAQFNKGFNFTLSRGRESIRVGSGLTSTVTDSIPFGRIHAIEARQPLFWRPFGWWRVRVTLAGHSVSEAGQSVTQNVVLPVGRHDDVVRVIETLVPGAATGITEGLIGTGEDYVGAGKRAGWLLWFGKRRAGVRIDVPADPAALTDATLRIRRGALTRSFAIMPIVRAQSVQLSRPLWHYVFKLASLQAHTVLGPVRVSVRGLALDDARIVFDRLSAAVLAVQRAESDGHPTTMKRNETDERPAI